MQKMTVDGTEVVYIEAGGGEPPIAFVHGWSCKHTFFAPQADHFSTAHRCVSVDLRGHHGLQAAPGTATIPTHASDVRAICVAALESPEYKEAARGFIEQDLFMPSDDEAVRTSVLEVMLDAPQEVMTSEMRSGRGVERFPPVSHLDAARLEHPVRGNHRGPRIARRTLYRPGNRHHARGGPLQPATRAWRRERSDGEVPRSAVTAQER